EQNNKRMHEVTDPLYFVIEEKMNSVDLTDKGVDLISSNVEDPTFFVLPDITAQLSALENETELTDEQRLRKEGCPDDQLCHQKRTCAYHQPTVEGIHHVRER
ncbi:preprotein translocase, SecA subunit, partial [human gut metagenome]